mmetsp:Transcript_31069/g.52476  ORF Transcript_31069/g.52476 Transcript_31069/m.52476 type:complete len:1178 (+) Transcript_31069:63-3596(+)
MSTKSRVPFPRVNFAELSHRVEHNHYSSDDSSKLYNVPHLDTSGLEPKFPVIPARDSANHNKNPPDPDMSENWFMVLSPRDTKGIVGPYSVQKLRQMYKSGEVSTTTLFWQEGEKEWKQLQYQRVLKPKLLSLPSLPPTVGVYNAELAVYDPVVKAPDPDLIKTSEEVKGFDITKACHRCGSMAVAHIPTEKGAVPDLFKCREEGGITEFTSEILPGFLWVGSSAAAKQRSIYRLGITLLFNLTPNMKNPEAKPPAYRCRVVPMKDSPKNSFTEVEKSNMLAVMEKLYDWMEAHRLMPELASRSDPTQREYRGPTDKYGLPIKTAEDLRVFRRPKDGEKPVFEPRILLWSRLGTDRACVVAAAYLIKHYRITVDHALHIVKATRPVMDVSAPYREVLELWSQRYVLGMLLCLDCKSMYDEESNSNTSSIALSKAPMAQEGVGIGNEGGGEREREEEEEEEEEDHSLADSSIAKEVRQERNAGKQNEEQKVNTQPAAGTAAAAGADSSSKPIASEPTPTPAYAQPGDASNGAGRLDFDDYSISSAGSSHMNHNNNAYVPPSASKLEEHYSAYEEVTSSHLKVMLKEKPHELKVLQDARKYLVQLPSHQTTIKNGLTCFAWSGVVDLELSGRHLSDVTLAVLFQLLADNQLIRQLRTLNLQANFIKSLALKALVIAFFPEGHLPDGTYFFDDNLLVSEMDPNYELMSLDVSSNCIDEFGVPYLTYFLRQTCTLMSVNVANNKLTEYLCADIIACFSRPGEDFEDGNSLSLGAGDFQGGVTSGHTSAHKDLKCYNFSVTSLNMGLNQFGEPAVEALTNMIKNNAVLRSLTLDLNPEIKPIMYKPILGALRLYNSVLEELSLSENKLSVKTAEYLGRLFDVGVESRISKLVLSNCGMKYQHIIPLCEHMSNSPTLMYIDFSNNKIGDKACEFLAEVIVGTGFNPLTGICLPPLEHVDLTNCGFQADGCRELLEAVAARPFLNRLDLSNNSFGADNPAGLEQLGKCAVQDLRLNCCGLGSKNTSGIFSCLASHETSLCQALRFCSLSGNEISDSVSDSLCRLLEKNLNLEVLDLGFNELTNRNRDSFKAAIHVASTSEAAKKVTGLSVNLIGNKCDPYMLDTPGMSRAKVNFQFGTLPNEADARNRGYSHIPSYSRGHFWARKELDDHYREQLPMQPLNTIA